MYVGRFLLAGRTQKGDPFAAYRVSSRSFPNRQTVVDGDTVSVVPEEGHETDVFDNPYIGYNCIRIEGETGIITNGSHTDPAAEKIAMGYPARDALAQSLLNLDYEKDKYDTPRIAATISPDEIYLGIARRDALIVRRYEPEEGEAMMVATYEKNDLPGDTYGLEIETARDAARAVYEPPLDLEHPVASAAVARTEGAWQVSTAEPPE